MIKVLFIFLVLVIAGVAGYSWLTLHWSYSTGERAGFVRIGFGECAGTVLPAAGA